MTFCGNGAEHYWGMFHMTSLQWRLVTNIEINDNIIRTRREQDNNNTGNQSLLEA